MEMIKTLWWDRFIIAIMILDLAAHLIGRIKMGNTYYDSTLRDWSIGLLYGSFALSVLTTIVLKRKKGVNFWLMTILVVVFALTFLAEWAGLIS